MSTTPDTGLPLLASQQSQPEITHNEAVTLLAALHNGVSGVSNTPAGSPAEGDAWIVGSAPSGAWAGRANAIATYSGGGWRFFPDRNSSGGTIAMGARHEGISIWRRDLDAQVVWSGSAWVDFTVRTQRLVKTLADADLTLTASEARSGILEFTGTLTAARSVVVPLGVQQWTVANLTTGGFAVTVVGATGTGVSIAAGKRAIVYADGTNVMRVTADV